MKQLDLFGSFRLLNRRLMPQCVLDANNGKGWFPAISTFTTWTIILVFLWKMINLIISFWNPDLSDFRYTEFFINFEGGFVRRGLLGECLLQLSKYTGVSPDIFISIGCLSVFLCVLAFFLREFKVNGYCWWMLFSPFLFGFTYIIIKTDFLLYGILILILLLIRPFKISFKRVVAASILMILSLFIHEGFIFWGVPTCLFLLFSQKRFRWYSVALLVVTVAVFLTLCFFKGNNVVAKAITDSWDGLVQFGLPGKDNAVSAIGWSGRYAFLYHIKANFVDNPFSYLGIVVKLGLSLASYYFIVNFLSMFSPDKFSNEKRIVLGSIWLLTLICMIPMLTILCCDYARVNQFIAVTAYSTLLIIPTETVVNAMPRWYINLIKRIDGGMRKFLPPSRGLMCVMLLTFAVPICSISFDGVFFNSIIGSFFNCIWEVFDLVRTTL